MKKEGSLKIILSILVIVLVTLVSIWGVYVKSGNTMKNKLPDYKYGMELKDTNIINLEVEKEEKSEEPATTATEENQTEEGQAEENGEASENKEENIYTEKNYRKSKELIEKRLKIMDVEQYKIRLDEKTGNMAIEVPTEVSSLVSQNAFSTGKFEIKIEDNQEVIGDNKSVQDVKASINKDYANVKGYGSIVELNFVFTKDATKKFNDIKNTYELYTEKEQEENQTEEAASEETDPTALVDNSGVEERKVTMYLDGTSLYSTTLEDFVKYASSGTLPLSIGGYSDDTKVLESALKQANITKSLILTENLPVKYKTTATTSNIHSNISKKSIAIVFAIILLVMCVFLIVKHKLAGIYGSLIIIGFISTLLLIVRFSNVALTISSICSVALMAVLQFIYILKLLKGSITSKKFNEKTVDFIKMLIPTFLMAIAISFAKTIELIGFGEVIFWGIIVFVIFNNIITRAMLTNAKNK